jgi:hypothetical protein
MRPLPTVRTVLRAAACAALLVLVAAACQPDVNMINADPLGTGAYPDESPLAPSNLTPTGFGQLFASTLDGQVYAQPLVNNGTLLAVTEHNSAYGLDPVTGATKWHTNYGTPWNPADLSCGDLVPEVGITGTPVIDPKTHHAYFTSKTYVSGTSGPAAWYLHDVDVATGAETAGWPVRIQGHADNDSTTVFDAAHEMQRAGLSLVNGVVYLAFGAHCDRTPYVGWVVGVSASTPAITTMWSTEIHQSGGGQAGIWQSGGGLVTDAAGSLYAVTGNGVTPSPGPGLGRPQPNGLGESVVKLTPSSGHLAVADWFTPSNAAQLNSYDGDLGSGGPVGLPDSFGTAAHRHLLAVAGKEGYLEVLDRDDLGGMAQGPGGTDRVVARVGPYGGVWSKPAVWSGDGGYLYLPTASPGPSSAGSSGILNVFKRVVDGSGNVSFSLAATSSDAFGFSSSSPVVTSDGTTSGSAVVWIIHTDGSSGAGAELRAYNAIPNVGTLTELWSAPIGTASKFVPPAVAGGRVYVGTRDGKLLGFGVLAGAPPLSGNIVTFPPTTVGNAIGAMATFTASRAATVTAASVQGTGFSIGAPSPALPASLAAGQSITVPVTYTPTLIGGQTGTLTLTTNGGAVSVPLAGTGQAATVPFGATPPSVDFGTLAADGPAATTAVSFRNNTAAPFTITGTTSPATPFSVTGLPAVGTVLAPGQSVGVAVTFTPPATAGSTPTTYNATLVVTSSIGAAGVPLKGTSAPPAQISISSLNVGFGSVHVGSSTNRSFTVGNTGGMNLVILKSKPPASGGFSALTTLAEGTVIPPGTTLTETVSFLPTATGAASSTWIITGDDGSGQQTVTFTGTGT